MPFYSDIRTIKDQAKRNRIVRGLKALREGFADPEHGIPSKSADNTLLMASWNIREFDAGSKASFRDEEAYYYIAEIISRFDIVAIQEVRRSLYPLQNLKRLLGSWWDFLVTDITLGAGGNSERMAFLYDRRKVDFTGLAAELVLDKAIAIDEKIVQFARSPYIAGFRAGWAYFTLVTVHVYYGKGVPVDERRLAEIQKLAETLTKFAPDFSSARVYSPDGKPQRDNLLLLGDFNIFNRKDVTMEALTKAGFVVPDGLQSIPGSNVDQKKHYDQIAYHKKLAGLKPTKRAGVFNFFDHVYRADQEADYAAERAVKGGRSYKDWRTFRMSDHLPMWVEFDIDDSNAYLDKLAGTGPAPP
ncbi:endonuclease/exonuclease/phosphatase family protein [Ciceribacter sp. L1K23]|uniref:endonuclease/exonuclease/phosphatase family protein n=1 Tax=Ciceribacter sp. L1K23 TaxID=2820276 RepID=UPI001B83F969|nr:endonuclease/exonuclease/phosphatase family protein [Ciceribacter sp. L1K23]MBR0555130.1 endonuclease/exonuclease/phosphatase family protein [Ciceribacter sp. L1K23]